MFGVFSRVFLLRVSMSFSLFKTIEKAFFPSLRGISCSDGQVSRRYRSNEPKHVAVRVVGSRTRLLKGLPRANTDVFELGY